MRSAGTIMDDLCRTSGQADIAQLRGARKAVEMAQESRGAEVTDDSTLLGAARAMRERLAADGGGGFATTMRPGSASFRGVTRDQVRGGGAGRGHKVRFLSQQGVAGSSTSRSHHHVAVQRGRRLLECSDACE